MSLELKPIKKLITIAFVLHIISLSLAMAFYIFQIPFRYLLFGNPRISDDEIFVFLPPTLVVLIVLIFIVHCSLTVGFRKAMGCKNNHLKAVRILSIVSVVFVLFVFPILNLITLDRTLPMGSLTFNELEAIHSTQAMISLGLTIRSLAFSVLLIAASMLWYHCFINKSENKELHTE